MARTVLRRAREAHPDWTPPPFEPEILAGVLGIPVHTRSGPLEWDALMIPIGEKPRIICNAAVRSPGRRRFSVAHEISHTFFRNALETYQWRAESRDRYSSTDEAKQLEHLCNLGAVELLMPEERVSDYLARIGLRAAAIPQIAQTFGTSLQAAALRVIELADEPCAAAFFHYGPQPSLANERHDPKLEPKRRNAYRAARLFRSQGFPFLLPRGKSVADDSAIYRASLRFEEIETVETFRLGPLAETLRVTALGLHREQEINEPPTVCALLRIAPQ